MSRMKVVVAAMVMGVLVGLTGCSSLGSPDEAATDEATSEAELSPYQIARLAAQVTWDDQTQSDREGMCSSYQVDPEWSLEQIEAGMADDPNPELLGAFRDLLEEKC